MGYTGSGAVQVVADGSVVLVAVWVFSVLAIAWKLFGGGGR
jgi:hypothetical protein